MKEYFSENWGFVLIVIFSIFVFGTFVNWLAEKKDKSVFIFLLQFNLACVFAINNIYGSLGIRMVISDGHTQTIVFTAYRNSAIAVYHANSQRT